jgi:hypothetical protein
MHRYCPQRGSKARIVQSVQQVVIVEETGINIPRICTELDNGKDEF